MTEVDQQLTIFDSVMDFWTYFCWSVVGRISVEMRMVLIVGWCLGRMFGRILVGRRMIRKMMRTMAMKTVIMIFILRLIDFGVQKSKMLSSKKGGFGVSKMHGFGYPKK